MSDHLKFRRIIYHCVNYENIWRSNFIFISLVSSFLKTNHSTRKHPTFNLHLDKIKAILTFLSVKFDLASIAIELVLILKRIIAFRSLLNWKKSLIKKKSGIVDQENIWSMLIWRVYVNGCYDQPSFHKNIKNILLISTFFRKNILCWVRFTINL